mmetsp:Transcript_4103/g.6355  ORF Transcript_4103/g.6355 Transcript_4103/m.6355 type:complete len:302 (-) Transcript_4103:81-986(-)
MADISVVMAGVFAGILIFLLILAQFLTVKAPGNWLCTSDNRAKGQFENYAICYSVVWISVFAVVVAGQYYEQFDETHYMVLCVSLALPFLLQPLLYPFPAEANLPLCSRYSFKANVWIAIFSFIGNYWYTHYFYSVLKAKYSFSSWRLNDVPIPLYFATHFYFVFYHTMSNLILRKIESRYASNFFRTLFFWSTVLAFSYFTAFMETLTISSFPDYSFEDRYMAYTVGSAFYGIYFIVSYPVFYRLDEKCGKDVAPHTLYQTCMDAFGASMIVLCLLDFCRLAMAIPLSITGKLYYLFKKV